MRSIKDNLIKRRALLACLAIWALGVVNATPACAQGLIWNLPPDGTWVRYEGEYTEADRRPDGEGEVSLQWVRHLWLKSVGQEQAEYQGKTVPCRWIEIKVVTGKEQDGTLQTGPGGTRLYKVLIPESDITGRLADEGGVPVNHIPIVKGWRQFDQESPQPMEQSALQIYPVISLVAYYKTLEPLSEEPVNPRVGLGAIQATHLKGERKMESRSFRSINTAELWRSDEVPFGLARWSVSLTREEKDATQPRSAFQMTSRITVEMRAQEQGTGARSELQAP